jgi:hypothetical protein
MPFRAGLLAAALIAATAASSRATVGSAGPPPPGAPGAVPRVVAGKPGAPGTSQRVFTMLYGDDHCFGLVAPKGWALDDTSGLGSKIRVVLYPMGQKWATAQTVMYVNPIHQDKTHRRTMDELIAQDVTAFQKAAPRGKVTVAPPVHTDKGQTAEVRYFAREGREPEEAVAYVMEKDLVMLLVLSSREDGGFHRALPTFRNMVASYQFVAGNIKTPTH